MAICRAGIREVVRLQPPADIDSAAHDAGVAAGDIDQDPVERIFSESCRAHGVFIQPVTLHDARIRYSQPIQIFPQPLEPNLIASTAMSVPVFASFPPGTLSFRRGPRKRRARSRPVVAARFRRQSPCSDPECSNDLRGRVRLRSARSTKFVFPGKRKLSGVFPEKLGRGSFAAIDPGVDRRAADCSIGKARVVASAPKLRAHRRAEIRDGRTGSRAIALPRHSLGRNFRGAHGAGSHWLIVAREAERDSPFRKRRRAAGV